MARVTGSRGVDLSDIDPNQLRALQQEDPGLFQRLMQQIDQFARNTGIGGQQTTPVSRVTGNVGMDPLVTGSVRPQSTSSGRPSITGDVEGQMATRGGVPITESGARGQQGSAVVTGSTGMEGRSAGGGGGGRRPPTTAGAAPGAGGRGPGIDIAGRYGDLRSSAGDLIFGSRNEAGIRPGRKAMGGKTGAVLGSVESLLSGDPAGALLGAPVGLATGQAANVLTNALTSGMMKAGPLPVRLAGAGLRYLVPGMVGYGAQQATAGAVNAVVGGAQQLAGGAVGAAQGAAGSLQSDGLGGLGGGGLSDLELPFIGPIGARAKARRQAEFEREQRRADQGLESEIRRQRAKEDLDVARQEGQIATQTYLDQMRGIAPLIEQQDRRRFTQQQALLNTQGSIYQSLGRQAGMFQLANTGLTEAGAYARTAISSNPYAGSVIQAPQITFGR